MQMLKVAHTQSGPAFEYNIDQFERVFGIHYTPQLKFRDWRVEQWLKKKCTKAYRKRKIGELGLWLGKLHGKEIEESFIPDVTIRWIHEKIGYGLFTNAPIRKWSYIGEYTGLLRRRNLFFPNVNDYCFMYPREWVSLKAYTIDSERHGNFTRFINHSDQPNLESVSVYYKGFLHIIFRAIQDIPAGSELTYDYGEIYWRNRDKWTKGDQLFS